VALSAGIRRFASVGLLTCLATALVPMGLAALSSLPFDRPADTSSLMTWGRAPFASRWLAAVTSPATLALSLALIAAIVAWWIWVSGHLIRPRTGGTGVGGGIPRTAGRGEHGTSSLMTPGGLEDSAVMWSPGTTPAASVSGFVLGARPAGSGQLSVREK